MEVITFEFIREIHRKEKEKKGLELEELPENFFSLVQQWLSEKEKLYSSTRNPEVLMEIENAKKLVGEIISQRQKKIVISALHVLRGGLPPENMLPVEEEFFDKLVALLNEYKSLAELEITGDVAREKMEEIRENIRALRDAKVSAGAERSEEKTGEKSEEGRGEKSGEEVGEEEQKREQKILKKVRVRALSNIPRFVDENLNTYGPYKKGEEFELPEDLVKILISRKVVEAVEGE